VLLAWQEQRPFDETIYSDTELRWLRSRQGRRLQRAPNTSRSKARRRRMGPPAPRGPGSCQGVDRPLHFDGVRGQGPEAFPVGFRSAVQWVHVSRPFRLRSDLYAQEEVGVMRFLAIRSAKTAR
jgi:hypothetical protein